jgi:hypothetical protein
MSPFTPVKTSILVSPRPALKSQILLHELLTSRCISAGNMPKKYGSDANANAFKTQLSGIVLRALM